MQDAEALVFDSRKVLYREFWQVIHRARYYDPANGRFNAMDSFRGYNDDPQSLHKYAYAYCDPINCDDPSGEIPVVSNWFYGDRVHRFIGNHFVGTAFLSSGTLRFYDTDIGTILGVRFLGFLRFLTRARPDLVQIPVAGGSPKVFEIKPVVSYLKGAAQLTFYLGVLNALDPTRRLWLPGQVNDYIPPTFVPIAFGVFAIVYPPVMGVILYQVYDVRTTALLVAALAISQLKSDIGSATLLSTYTARYAQ